jgi:hypothetical protein
MNNFGQIMKLIVFVCLTLTCASLAQAQATRTWVSGVGDDANPCSRTAPCKTFAGAISKTANNGEIDVIDPGGFGAVTITKSITIDGAGTMGSILASGGVNGVIINDTSNLAIVTLRNLSINGAGTGLNGIRFLQGKQLTVQNVEIFGFTGNGIDAPLSVGATGGSFVFLNNVNIRDLKGASSIGIRLSAATVNVLAHVDEVHVQRVPTGIQFGTNAFGMVRNSVLANGTNGIEMTNGSGSVTTIENTLLNYNTNGINAGSGTTAYISNLNIIQCGTAITNTGGVVFSSGNNRILGNGADGLTPTIVNPK